ncbi:MAG: CBS domain-containing protein [Alphaproteobacteria bacterium]|nr:CBS domain-containing protein [Alphaproteobacteria bacterium]
MDANSTTREIAPGETNPYLFVLHVAAASPDTPCADIQRRFLADPGLTSIPVCDATRPVGLVDRFQFLSRFANGFGQAMYANKPVSLLMDHKPIVVERADTVGAIKSRLSSELTDAGVRGFIVAERGRYVGIGSVLGLLRASLRESEAMNGRLAEALAQSESEGQLKSKFLANLSHEFRTPLNAIIGFSDIMAREISGPLNGPYRDYVNDILASGQHLLSVINDLLDLAKIESGDIRPSPEPVDAADAIDVALKLVVDDAAKAALIVESEIEPGLRPIAADPLHVRQILLNLLSNAIKFTPRGKVAIAARAAGERIAIVVSDTGIGMTTKEIQIALRPFGQVASHLTRTHEGPGLGLPLVKALTTGNGATFEIESEPGRGTKVTIAFPTVGENSTPSTARGGIG